MASQRYRAYFGDFRPRFFGVFINFAVFMRNRPDLAVTNVWICFFSYYFYSWPNWKRLSIFIWDIFYEIKERFDFNL